MNLDDLREYSYNTVLNNSKFGAPDQGKPDDYGFSGKEKNPQLNARGATRMATHGLLGGLASAGIKTLEDAIVAGLEPVIDSAAQVIKGERPIDFTPNLGTLGTGMY